MSPRVTAYLSDLGPRSAAVARIAIAFSLMLVLWQHIDTPEILHGQPVGLYQPVGIMKWFAPSPPTVVALKIIYAIAWAATAMMLFGIFSRLTSPLAFTASLVVVSASYGFEPAWNHGAVPTFLAHLALLPCPLGDRWSLDARWRARCERPRQSYTIPLRGAQWLVALFFFNAAYWKLSHSGLSWALSDNLRNIFADPLLLVR